MGVLATTNAQVVQNTVLYYQNLATNNVTTPVTNSSSDQALRSSDNQDNKDKHSPYAALMPWAKGWKGFSIDLALSCFTYFLTYLFFGAPFLTPLAPNVDIQSLKLPKFAKNILDYAAAPVKMPNFIKIINSHLNPEEKKKFQTDILDKLHDHSPFESEVFWKEHFDKYIINNKEAFQKLSKADRFAAKFCRKVYGDWRRWSFVTLISFTSLFRALIVNPHLPPVTFALIFGLPFLTNTFFNIADKKTAQLDEAKKLGKSVADLETLELSQKKWTNWSTLLNFGAKVGVKSSKRATQQALEAFGKLITFQGVSAVEGKDALMLGIAVTASTASRVTRDLLEDGIKDRERISMNANPIMRFVVNRNLIQSLRDIKIPLGQNKDLYLFRKGLLSDFDPSMNHSYVDSWKYIGIQVGIKSALKYFTDSLLFGIIGITSLKLFELLTGKPTDIDAEDNKKKQYAQNNIVPIYGINGLTSATKAPAYVNA